jgi:N-acetyl-gamma-glutamyl-phosphate reductase
MIQVNIAVFGASGYSGEELLRRLERLPTVNVRCITSRQYAGKSASEIFPWLDTRGPLGSLRFVEPDIKQIKEYGVDVAFLALPHGVAAEFAKPLLDVGITVLDLSADFRVHDPEVYAEFYGATHPAPELLERSVYGLPEVYREQIRKANLIACPGCYPTSILLPVLPLIQKKLISPGSIIATSMSGVSGAGRKVDLNYLFVECNESVRPYGVPKHRHLSEIEQEISIAAGEPVQIQFAPHLVPLNRGIVSTIHVDLMPGVAQEVSLLTQAFEESYGSERFVRLLGTERYPDTKNVVHTNLIEIAWRLDPRTGKVILFSALDNLVKGASGQAIQCLDLIRGGNILFQ